MLNSGKKNSRKATKKKYSNFRVVRKNYSERNKKPYPPCKLNGRSLMVYGQSYFVILVINILLIALQFIYKITILSYRVQIYIRHASVGMRVNM